MDIKKYSSLLVGVIVEDISYIPSRSYGDEYLSIEEWFIMMNEFLIYDLPERRRKAPGFIHGDIRRLQ